MPAAATQASDDGDDSDEDEGLHISGGTVRLSEARTPLLRFRLTARMATTRRSAARAQVALESYVGERLNVVRTSSDAAAMARHAARLGKAQQAALHRAMAAAAPQQ